MSQSNDGKDNFISEHANENQTFASVTLYKDGMVCVVYGNRMTQFAKSSSVKQASALLNYIASVIDD
ncbi:hypothetical protein GCM10011369_18650 [Neiella marina]|uniref:Uncharacterized protein n=1 Tax=Neiella marina TaxID=508461 RepID=A0A8J2XPI4_9GAMM|nr:hypothetical protein [Neiella marina]GGA77013.1 hypothetical protein GCM10011369_18650 [Neiella marina]